MNGAAAQQDFRPAPLRGPRPPGLRPAPAPPRPLQRDRRHGHRTLRGSICIGTLSLQGPAAASGERRTRKMPVAMKCLRPQIRSNAEQFLIGVEDLVHETAVLASLSHPHIIKLHGRARGTADNSLRLSDGYFILIDRLRGKLVVCVL